MAYVRPYWGAFAVAIVGMILTAATEPLFPALMKPLLDGSFVNRDHSIGYWMPFALVGIFVVRGILTYVSSYAMSWVSNNVILDMRTALFKRLLHLPSSYFENNTSGALLSKIAYDVSGVSAAATSVLTVLVRDSFTVIGLLAWLVYLNWKLTLVTLIVVPAVALIIRLTGQRLRRMSTASMKAMGEVTHVLEETIKSQKVVKVFGGEDYEARRFERANQSLRSYNMRQTIAASLTAPAVQLFASIALAIIIAIAPTCGESNVRCIGAGDMPFSYATCATESLARESSSSARWSPPSAWSAMKPRTSISAMHCRKTPWCAATRRPSSAC